MKQQLFIFSLVILIFGGCQSSKLTTTGTDDVYFRSPTEVSTRTAVTTVSPESAPQSKYENRTDYGTYQDSDDYGYTSYTSRVRRFQDPFSSFDYYNPYYSNNFSFGFSGSNFGYSSPWNGYYNPWQSNYYDPFQQYSWYNPYSYQYQSPFYNYYNPWGYSPMRPYNYYGWNPWRPNYPWYNNDQNYYHPPTDSKPSYYGPRNWSGSNTNTDNDWGNSRENSPSTPNLPSNNSNYGRSTTPSGIQIEKGDKFDNKKIDNQPLTPSKSEDPGIQNPRPRQEIKYYRPAEKMNNDRPREYNPPVQNNEPGIKIEKGRKY